MILPASIWKIARPELTTRFPVRITHAIELAKHGGRLARIASPTTFFNAAAFC